eukprot:m.241308 g.241308  ORF g.241308 m.241308 type:complete len:1061 (-) comp54421_c0_seq1:287-3469(-)
MPPRINVPEEFVHEDYVNVPVKFLGHRSYPKAQFGREAFQTEMTGLMTTNSKDFRGNIPKDLLLTLSAAQGNLNAIPKSGGRAIFLDVRNVLDVRDLEAECKFAVVYDEPSLPARRDIVAFQLKQKATAATFISSLKRVFREYSEKGGAAPTASKGSRDDDRVRELEKLLSEQKVLTAQAEVAHLQAVVKCASAERETAETKTEIAELRAEMASVAADMASDMARLKTDTHDQSTQSVLSEISYIKKAVDSMQTRLVRQSSKDKVGADASSGAPKTPELLRKGYPTSDPKLAAELQAVRVYVESLKRASETSGPKGTADAQSTAQALLSLQSEMRGLRQENVRLSQELRQSEETRRALDQEKKLLADTIAGLTGSVSPPRQSTHTLELPPPSMDVDTDGNYPGQESEILHEFRLTKGTTGLGFSIAGGIDDPVEDGDSSIYITHIAPGGTADLDGKLKVGDRLIEVDDHKLDNTPHDTAVKILQQTAKTVRLLIGRLPNFEEEQIEVIELVKGPSGLGFSIAGGIDYPVEAGDTSVYITDIIKGGAAFTDGRLRVGDKLMSVNERSLLNVTHDEAVKTLQQTQKIVTLTVSRIIIQEDGAGSAAETPQLEHQGSQPKLNSQPPAPASMAKQHSSNNIPNANNGQPRAGSNPGESVPEVIDTLLEDVFEIAFQRGPNGLGFSIAGGTDHPIEMGNTSVYVTQLIPSGAAEIDGRLRPGDRLVEVNGVNVLSCPHEAVVRALQLSSKDVSMKISRPPESREETMEFFLERRVPGGLGFSIAGGTDDPAMADDVRIYVTLIAAGAAAALDGRLMVGDRILQVNDVDVTSVLHAEAVRALQSNPKGVQLTVSRDVPVQHAEEQVIQEISFKKASHENLGFSIAGGTDDAIEDGDTGIYITKIMEGSVAALDGRLLFGDKIMNVNGIGLENVTHGEAVRALQSQSDSVSITVTRIIPPNEPVEVLEEIEFAKGPQGFGFSIAGGSDAPIADGDTNIYITQIVPSGAAEADGRLLLGDKVLVVNEVNLSNVPHSTAVRVLQAAATTVKMIVCRPAVTDDFDEQEAA